MQAIIKSQVILQIGVSEYKLADFKGNTTSLKHIAGP